MARYFDDLRRNSGIVTPLHDMPVIAAENVQDYVFSIGYGKTIELVNGLPMTPPFEYCFIEYGNMASTGDVDCGHFIKRETTDTGWAVTVLTFMRWDRESSRLLSIVEFDLDRRGIVSGEARILHYSGSEDLKVYLVSVLAPMWLTLVFFNTKKVEQIETVPPEGLSKRHRKKYGHPLTKFYTLKVNPVNRAAGEHQGGSHSAPAHHIVRGHFRRYTDDAPLFGKWSGVFWWGEFERGKKERGEVEKDYQVSVPEGFDVEESAE